MKFAGIASCTVLLLVVGCHSGDPQPDDHAAYKLSSISTYREDGGNYTLSYVTTYEYSNQKILQGEKRSLYNAITTELTPYSRKTFTRDAQGRVILMEATIINTNVEESLLYHYRSDGTLASMHLDADISADVAVTNEPGDTLQAVYLLSTGAMFTYRVFMKNGNAVYDKTINSENNITDETTRTFDDHVNPYSMLGYVDYLFTNYSKNNPLTASTQEYIGHQELRPESYEYTYNEVGLPATQIITYASGNPSRKAHMKYVFEYVH